MRLVLVHGINQQGLSSDALAGAWLEQLRRTAGRDGDWPKGAVSRIDAPYYGDILSQMTANRVQGNAVAQGADDAEDEFSEFAGDAFVEMAERIGASHQAIEDEAEDPAVAQGAGFHKTWLKAAARVVEAISPWKGALALRVLSQAHAYLKRDNVREAVNDTVRPALEDDEPAIIVAHSLGTIVTYRLLREFAEQGRPRAVPLFVTLGSPLGIKVIRNSFPLPRTRPAAVQRWLNGADVEDFVALRPELTPATFGTGVENIADIDNGYEDPHAALGYLSSRAIADAVAAAIDGGR